MKNSQATANLKNWKKCALPISASRTVLPNLFSTTAHFLGTSYQTAHCIYGTYFIAYTRGAQHAGRIWPPKEFYPALGAG